MSSGIFRFKKLRETVTQTARFASSSLSSSSSSSSRRSLICTQFNSHHHHHYHRFLRRESLLGLQKRYKWEGSGSGSGSGSGGGGGSDEFTIRKIREESNCPRCAKQMDLVFSERSGGGNGDNNKAASYHQAVNLCPNCKSTYSFHPHKFVPLQGTFTEIGRIKRKDNHRLNKKKAGSSSDERVEGNNNNTNGDDEDFGD